MFAHDDHHLFKGNERRGGFVFAHHHHHHLFKGNERRGGFVFAHHHHHLFKGNERRGEYFVLRICVFFFLPI